MEQAVEEQAQIKEVSIDDLPDKSSADMYHVITLDDEIAEGTIFTIKEVRLRPPMQDAKICSHSEPSKDGVGFVASRYTISLPSFCPKSAGKLFNG